MSMINKMADRVAGVFLPQVTADAGQNYYQYWCTPFDCGQPGLTLWRRRYCGESWCGNWVDIGCC